jgi:hypothetical protein
MMYGIPDAQLQAFSICGGSFGFRLRPLYPRGKLRQYPMNNKVGGPQKMSLTMKEMFAPSIN